MEFSKLAEMDIAEMTMEELAEFAAQATAIAKKAKDASKANESALKAKYEADKIADSNSIQASIKHLSLTPNGLVGIYDNPPKFSGTIQTIDGVLHITDFSLGSAIRGNVAPSFARGVKFTIDGKKTWQFNKDSNLNFDEFGIGEIVELTSGKRVLLALGYAVKSKKDSKEASSTSKLKALDDTVKDRIGVIMNDGATCTLAELLDASE